MERHHSFNEPQSEALHKIFEYLDPRSTNALMSEKTIRCDIKKYFETAKATIKKHLSLARSRIYISYDLWTSPNHKAMIAIVAHWTAEDYEVKSALLMIKEVYGEHSNENIANVVYSVMKEYDFDCSFSYFVGDNALNNNTSIEWLDQLMRDDGYEGFEPEKRRLRCFAHEMQIATKGLLFGPNVKELEEYPATADVTEEEKREYVKKKWRAFGAVGKLHNVVKYIRGSLQRRERYSNLMNSINPVDLWDFVYEVRFSFHQDLWLVCHVINFHYFVNLTHIVNRTKYGVISHIRLKFSGLCPCAILDYARKTRSTD